MLQMINMNIEYIGIIDNHPIILYLKLFVFLCTWLLYYINAWNTTFQSIFVKNFFLI